MVKAEKTIDWGTIDIHSPEHKAEVESLINSMLKHDLEKLEPEKKSVPTPVSAEDFKKYMQQVEAKRESTDKGSSMG